MCPLVCRKICCFWGAPAHACDRSNPAAHPTPSFRLNHTATMQTVVARTSQKAVAPARACSRPSLVRAGAVKCQAVKAEQVAQKAAVAAAGLPALLAASPAFALVDDRLNGDGVGYALGVSDPVLGWVIGGVASLIWIAYFIAQKDFGDFEDKDSGVGL